MTVTVFAQLEMKTRGRWETSEKFQFLLPTSSPVAKLS